ncbi:MFS transporter, partial [Sphingomonas sp. CCH9-F2]
MTPITHRREIDETLVLKRRWITLALLTLTYFFSFMDRQILAILLEPIKRDLSLSDTQLGLLSGLVFAIFYATLGIPIARLADRTSRRNIIAASLAVWSVMTALCGVAQNFTQLLLARVGVGVGEAGA